VECWLPARRQSLSSQASFSVFAARADATGRFIPNAVGTVAHEEKNPGRRYRGTYVKLLMSRRVEREFVSGPRMGPAEFVNRFKQNVRGWNFDVASIGLPAPMRNGRIIRDPKHLGKGLGPLQFCTALGIPVRVSTTQRCKRLAVTMVGECFFWDLARLGLRTAVDKTLMPLELGDLPYRDRHIIENHLGIPGLELLGEKKWKREVAYAVTQLRKSFIADYVILAAVWCTGFVDCQRELSVGAMKMHFSWNPFVGNRTKFARTEMASAISARTLGC